MSEGRRKSGTDHLILNLFDLVDRGRPVVRYTSQLALELKERGRNGHDEAAAGWRRGGKRERRAPVVLWWAEAKRAKKGELWSTKNDRVEAELKKCRNEAGVQACSLASTLGAGKVERVEATQLSCFRHFTATAGHRRQLFRLYSVRSRLSPTSPTGRPLASLSSSHQDTSPRPVRSLLPPSSARFDLTKSILGCSTAHSTPSHSPTSSSRS